jgi:hypothetical protein
LHFFVQAPHLWDLARIAPHILHDLFLRLNNSFQDFRLRTSGHGSVVVSSHPDSDNVFIRLRALSTFGEELVESGVVGNPRPIGIAALGYFGPFLGCPDHGLGVRRAHHYPVSVGKRLVTRIVDIEHGAPHRGPEIVRSAPQQQLKYMGVELSTERRAVCGLGILSVGPSCQCGCFIVDEETAIFHCGSLLNFGRAEGVDARVGLGRNISEPVPR